MKSKYSTNTMSQYWLMGFVGGIMMIGALVLFLLSLMVGCVNSLSSGGGSSGSVIFALSIATGAAGSYLRYLSRQAQFDPTDTASSANISIAVAPVISEVKNDVGNKKEPINFSGERSLSNDAYKIFLVKKYDISKNDVLDKFIVMDKLFPTIDAALEAAHEIYSSIKDEIPPSDPIGTCPQCQADIARNSERCPKCDALFVGKHAKWKPI